VTEYGLRDGTEEPRTTTKKTGASFDSFKFLKEYQAKKIQVKNSQNVHKIGNNTNDNNLTKNSKAKPLESAIKAIYHEEQNKLSANTSCNNSINEEGQTAPRGPATDSYTRHQHSSEPIAIEGGKEQVGHPIKPSGQSTRDPINPVEKPKPIGKICAFDKNQSVHTKIHAVNLEDQTITKYFAKTPEKATTEEHDTIEIIEDEDKTNSTVAKHDKETVRTVQNVHEQENTTVSTEHQHPTVYSEQQSVALMTEHQHPAVISEQQSVAVNTEHQHPCLPIEQQCLANNIEHQAHAPNTEHHYQTVIIEQQNPAVHNEQQNPAVHNEQQNPAVNTEQQSAWPKHAYSHNGLSTDYIPAAQDAEYIIVTPYTEGYEDDNGGYRETTYFVPDNGGGIYQVENATTSHNNYTAYNNPEVTNTSNSPPLMNTKTKAKLDLEAWMQQNCRVTAQKLSPTTCPNNNPVDTYQNWIAKALNKPTDNIPVPAPLKKRRRSKNVQVSEIDHAKAELHARAADNAQDCPGPAADSLKVQTEVLVLPSDHEEHPRPLSSDTGYFSHKETASSSTTPLPSPPHSPNYLSLDNKDIKPVEKTICPPNAVAEPPPKKSRLNFTLEDGATRTDEAGRWVVTTLGTTKSRADTDTELVKIGCVEMTDLHLEPETSIKTAMKKSARGRTKKKELEIISRKKDVVFIEPKAKQNRQEIRSIKHLACVTRRIYQEKSLKDELSMLRARNMQLKARMVELKGLLDANMKAYMSAIATGDLVWANPSPFIAS